MSASLNTMEPQLKNVNNCLNTNIYCYLDASDGQNSKLYLNVVHFLTSVLIRHLWQRKTVVFLHCCQICAVLLHDTVGIQKEFYDHLKIILRWLLK